MVLIFALFPAIAAVAQPTINSTPVTTGTYGFSYTYNISTDTWPTPTNLRITLESGAPGITLTDHLNGTATLTGTPASAGIFPISIKVRDITDEQNSSQPFNLNIAKATLTVFADDKFRPYGSSATGFTFSYAGFRFTDNIGALTTLPTATTTATPASDVGEYSITPAGAVDENYSFNYVNGKLTITKVPLTITADNKSKVYGDVLPDFTLSYTGFVNDDDASDIEDAPDILTTATSASHVGSYTISLANGSDQNYNFTLVTGTLTVTKATITAKAVDVSKNYYDDNPPFTITYSGFVNGDSEGVLDMSKPTASTIATKNSNAGAYDITLSGGTDNDYLYSYVKGTLTINKLTLTITADSKSRPYGSDNPPFTFVYSGFVNGETSSALTTLPTANPAASNANAGSYPITPSGAASPNYTFNYVNGTLTITKINLTITADNKTKVYGAVLPQFTLSYAGFITGESSLFIETPPEILVAATAASPVGDYTISLVNGSDQNYNFTLVPGTLTVTKAVITATADNKSRVYGGSNPPFTVSYTGFVNGDNIGKITPGSATSEATPTSGVGSHTITPSGASAVNYSFSYVDGTLTITPAVLTVTAVNVARQYASPDPPFSFTITGFKNGETSAVLTQQPSGTTNANNFSNVGNYTITPGGAAAANYTFNYVNGLLFVQKAALNAFAQPKTKIYGQDNPPLTIAYTGFRNNDDASMILTPPTLTTIATTNSPVGTYAISNSGGLDENYLFNNLSSTLTITKAVLTATANSTTRKYGDPNPEFTVSYSGFVGTDGPGDILTPPTLGTTAGPTTNVGNQTIAIWGAADENYSFNYVPGTLQITKAPLTAKPNDTSRPYGSANPAFTFSYTGFVNGETESVINTPPTGTTEADNTSNVGAYTITASNASDNNYDFTYNTGTLTVVKAPLTITANNQTKTYGAVNPPLTLTYTGFKNGETAIVLDQPAPSISTEATQASPVGTYDILFGNNAPDNNYAYTLVKGTLAVTKANLFVTADNKTREYKTLNPEFTRFYSGFLNGDTETSITPPGISTIATETSPVGNYPINFTGGSAANYNIVPVSGTLTITKATPIVTWNNPAPITYGTPLSSAQLNASANVAGTFVYDDPEIGEVLDAGANQTLHAVFNPSDLTNYNSVTGITATITVNKATPIITWANPSAITYGTLLNSTNHLNATSNAPGAFTYTPPVGTLLTTGANQVLKADFHPTNPNNYNDVLNIQRQITVNKATPIVTWNNPAPIVYGTPLSATQLNATFSVPGTASYIPTAGTILPAGNQPLSVNFTPNDLANYLPVTGTQVVINVLKATPVITWANAADITYGTALGATQLNASSNGVSGSFTYNPPASTILSAGSGQVLSATFTPSETSNYNTVTNITRTINVNKADPVITWGALSGITYGTPLGATQLNASSSVAGGFAYNPASGTVLNAGANQSITATFTPADQANYNSKVVNNTITVNKAVPVVTWPSPAQITYGTPLGPTQQNASANIPGNFIYTPAAGTILTTGTNQNISVRFEPNDMTNYSVVAATTTQITVVKATPEITWATPLPIKVGVQLTATQLNATADVQGTFVYSPDFGQSFSTQGTYTLHASFTPNDQANYNSVPDTQVQIVVSSKDNPVITWNDPATIAYGTLLSDDPGTGQLNATASVPGTFVYNPAVGTKLNAGANQNLTVTFHPTDAVNYNSVARTVHISVNKATLTAKATDASRAYGGANPTFNINYTGFVGADNAGVIDTQPTITCDAIASDPAGSTFPIKPTGGSDNNYQFTYVNGTLTINKASLTATADDKSRPYGLSNPAFTISYSGFTNGDDASDITPPTPSTIADISSKVDTYTIALNGGSASNYDITRVPGTLNVTKALLGVSADPQTKVYGQDNPQLTYKYLGFVNGDDADDITTPPVINTTATAASGVGVYPINVSGGTAHNYSLALFIPSTLTVTQATLTIKADNKTRPYGQANPDNSMSFSGFVNGDDPGDLTSVPTYIGPIADLSSNVNTYNIQLTGGSAVNYDIVLQNGTLTVTKATLTAKADDQTRLYGQANPQFTISYSGFLNDDNVGDITPPTPSTEAKPISNVDTYAITLANGSALNYSFDLQPGNLTVTPAPLIAKAADRSRPYGQPNPTFPIIYTGFLNGDNATKITPPTANTTAIETSPIGAYDITLSGGSALNYTLTLQPGTLSISRAVLTVKADNKTKYYGDENPDNTLTYTGFLNGDDPGDITPPTIEGPDATSGSPVGDYDIKLKDGSADNYDIALVNGSLTIMKAPLTVKADNQSRPYRTGNPDDFTVVYTGFKNGDGPDDIDKPVVSTPATITSDVGTYPIQLSGATRNYEFTFIEGTLTINKATVKITAENKSRTYGSDNPVLTVTYQGLGSDETSDVIDTPPTITTTATRLTPVSTVDIHVADAVDHNYDFEYFDGSLTIDRAPLTAKADNKSKSYGSENPGITITYTGFMNNEGPSNITEPAISTDATVTSPVGTYAITLADGSADNYAITLVNGTLTVTPAVLTVTAADQTRTYGANNPALTLNYNGFVNGETIANIDQPPVATTTAVITSQTGSYPITPAGAADANYSFQYTPGTMTITKATVTATADTKTTTYGTIPELTITYTGFRNGETATVLDQQPVISTTATATSELGTYPVTLNGGADNNYNVVNVAGTITIVKAPLTATADDKSRIIGLADPVFTISYSGFVNNESLDDINELPIARTTATTSSPAGNYPINVTGGNDDHYEFVYKPGTLVVILDNAPVVKNFQVDSDEDTRLNFTLSLFATNYTDDPNGKIFFVKITSLPVNGALFKDNSRVVAGDEIQVTNNELTQDLSYVPNSNYAGNDAFGWNLFDGSFLAVNNATVTIKVLPVNDPPVLSNIETSSLEYSPGDQPVRVTEQMIINDVDDNFLFSASVLIEDNYTEGDALSVQGGVTGTKIEASYDAQGGELKLTGKETRAIYETILKKVTFSTTVNGGATVSEKNITMVVRDSIANSNIASRKIAITQVFPELDIVNAFTPNGDNVNDYWDIINLDSYSDVMITVFNTAGTKVFSCNSTDCKWDGRTNGELQPAGPYSYVIDLNQGKRRYRGTVTVLR